MQHKHAYYGLLRLAQQWATFITCSLIKHVKPVDQWACLMAISGLGTKEWRSCQFLCRSSFKSLLWLSLLSLMVF